MALNIDNLKKKTSRAIDRLPDDATVFRPVRNAFNEPVSRQIVTVIRGQYYRGSYNRGRSEYASVNMTDAGQTAKKFPEKFMTVIDENSSLVAAGDILEYGGYTYSITDIGDSLGVYYDMSLERL